MGGDFLGISTCLNNIVESPDLIWFLHLPGAFVLLTIALFVHVNNRQFLSKTFFTLAIIFACWSGLNLYTWFIPENSSIYASVALQTRDILQILLLLYTLFFSYEFLKNRSLTWKIKIPSILGVVGAVYTFYTYSYWSTVTLYCRTVSSKPEEYLLLLSAIVLSTAIAVSIYHGNKSEKSREQSPIVVIALLSLFYTFVIAKLLTLTLKNITYEVYGLFTVTLFVLLISTLIVGYRELKLTVTGANVIVIVLIAIVGIKIFIFTNTADLVVDLTTTFLAIIFSYILLQSHRREHKQKLKNQQLNLMLTEANDQLQILDKQKSEFLSIASHQLRSPLTAIKGYTSMLLDGTYGQMPENAIEPLSRISESSHYMNTSIEDYLNISRIQAGNMEYEMTNFNLIEITQKLCEDMDKVAKERGLNLTCNTPAVKEILVYADIGKTRQVLQNLIDNAIKYTPEGNVTLDTRLSNDSVYVDITDTGIGIEPEDLDKLFNKFKRADDASKINSSGTGLGLYIARKMAGEMGGELTGQSAGTGTGSTFTLKLPLLPS